MTSRRNALWKVKPPVWLLHHARSIRLAQVLAAVHVSHKASGSTGACRYCAEHTSTVMSDRTIRVIQDPIHWKKRSCDEAFYYPCHHGNRRLWIFGPQPGNVRPCSATITARGHSGWGAGSSKASPAVAVRGSRRSASGRVMLAYRGKPDDTPGMFLPAQQPASGVKRIYGSRERPQPDRA